MHFIKIVDDLQRKLPEEVSLMTKCLTVTALTILIGLATYIALTKFGVYTLMDKLHLALIPSVALGVLTCLFIWLNRKCWKNIVSKATAAHFATWIFIVFLFIIAPNIVGALGPEWGLMFRLIVYFLGFLWPTQWINLVEARCAPLPYSLMLGLHGGVGAYCMVVLANYFLTVAGIPLPVSPAKFFLAYTPPKEAVLTIVPYKVLAAMVQPAILIILYACYVEEIMFRLPLALFKKFGMYPMAFLISFLFTYLHALSRLDLDSTTLIQVLTCIACANSIFIAVYTRTLCIWCSVVAHMIYNLMVLSSVPPIVAFALLIFNGIVHILLARIGFLRP